jgi:hypothetical protein
MRKSRGQLGIRKWLCSTERSINGCILLNNTLFIREYLSSSYILSIVNNALGDSRSRHSGGLLELAECSVNTSNSFSAIPGILDTLRDANDCCMVVDLC